MGRLPWVSCWCMLLGCLLLVDAAEPPSSNDVASQQPFERMSKRGWNNLHGGWAVKRNELDDGEDPFEEATEKRAWKNLQREWGKRDIMNDGYMKFRGDPPKRSRWADLNESWGKRNFGWGALPRRMALYE